MGYLFLYMVICYVAAWCAVHIDPMNANGEEELIKDGEFTKKEIRTSFGVALIPVVNLYVIFIYVSLSFKPLKKTILLRIKKMIEEVENE